MPGYRAYGLSIDSELPLPELVEDDRPAPDVTIRLGALAWPLAGAGSAASPATDSEVSVRYEGVGAFRVRRGREITVAPMRGAGEGAVRFHLLSRGLAILLHQRGGLVLHGSAVAVGDRAVVLLGAWGQGKSTLAAALWRRGHHLLTDDVAALVVADDRVDVLPSFPQIRLADGAGKRGFRVEQGFSATPVPLGRVYELADGPGPVAAPLSPREAFATLARHRYLSPLLLGPAATRARFRGFLEVARRVPFSRLVIPRTLDALPDVLGLVEDDLGQPTAALGVHG